MACAQRALDGKHERRQLTTLATRSQQQTQEQASLCSATSDLRDPPAARCFAGCNLFLLFSSSSCLAAPLAWHPNTAHAFWLLVFACEQLAGKHLNKTFAATNRQATDTHRWRARSNLICSLATRHLLPATCASFCLSLSVSSDCS